MVRNGRVPKCIYFAALVASAVLLFSQSCTNQAQFSRRGEFTLKNGEGGNGSGYDGKLVILHHKQLGFTCEGKDFPESILLRRDDGKWFFTQNTTEKCGTIFKQPVDGVQYDELTRQAYFKSKLYVPPVVFRVLPLVAPNAPDVDVEDGICAEQGGLCSLAAAFEQAAVMGFVDSLEIFVTKGLYKLTSQVEYSNPTAVKVRGEDRNETILDGGSVTRIFEIYLVNGSLQLADLTFRNGKASGGVEWGGAVRIHYADFKATINRCLFDGNSAGRSGGALSIHGSGGTNVPEVSNSQFVNNRIFSSNPQHYFGDAIYATGGLVISDSLFSGNGSPGGLRHTIYQYNGGPHVMRNSAVINNHSLRSAYHVAECTVSPCLIENSTIAMNAGVGADLSAFNGTAGDYRVNFTTFFHNGLGRAGPANLVAVLPSGFDFRNSIAMVANPATQSNCSLSGGGMSGNGNISNDTTCDLSPVAADALLNPLADNGGPTPTMMPGFGSPALDAIVGVGACAPTDQRGVPRSEDGPCDIGSVEYR